MTNFLDKDDQIALKQRKHLRLIRDILDEIGASHKLFNAVDQALADNDNYMSSEAESKVLTGVEVDIMHPSAPQSGLVNITKQLRLR